MKNTAHMTGQRKRSHSLLGAISAVALMAATPVFADTGPQEFTIKAQPLAAALADLSAQANVSVFAPGELARGKTVSALAGTMTAEQALAQLLAGTGLTFQMNGDGSYIVARETGGDSDANIEGSTSSFVLEEIIVTAEKRAESLQDIPIAISAFSGESMERAGVSGISDLKQLAPSVQFGQHNGPQTFVSIRGIGSVLRNIGAEAGVTISQDTVPFFNQFMFDADFFDIERVEVLRGPQGTISGRNATGGAINIHSKKPTEELVGGLKATFGNYGYLGVEGYVSGPITDSGVLARLAVKTERSDGWLRNTLLNEDRFDKDKVHARASFLAMPTENLEAHLVLEGMIDRGVRATGVDLGRARPDQPGLSEVFGEEAFNPDTLEYQADFPEHNKIESYKTILKLTWDISPNSTLTSSTSYLTYERTATFDFDGTAIAQSHFPDFLIDLWQLSQELTFATDLSDNMDLILGGLYMRGSADEPLSIGLPLLDYPLGSIQLLPEQDLYSYAFYSQFRYHLSDTLRIAVGARYTRDKKDVFEKDIFAGFSAPPLSAEKSWGAFTPRVAIDYSPNDDLTIYASISRGFKAGGFNTYGAFDGAPNDFDPEFVWNYEVGMKGDWFDNRLRAAVTGFYMDYTNLQQDVFIVPEGALVPLTVVRNASAATIYGAEMEMEAHLTEAVKVTSSATWLNTQYDELESNDPVFPELGERDLAGNKIIRAPEFQFNIGGEYMAPVADDWIVILRANYQWQDKVYFSFYNHPLNSQDSYGVLNLSASFETEDGQWQFSVFANNVLDKNYVIGAEVFDVGGTPAPTKHLFGLPGEPRMYGASMKYQF